MGLGKFVKIDVPENEFSSHFEGQLFIFNLKLQLRLIGSAVAHW